MAILVLVNVAIKGGRLGAEAADYGHAPLSPAVFNA